MLKLCSAPQLQGGPCDLSGSDNRGGRINGNDNNTTKQAELQGLRMWLNGDNCLTSKETNETWLKTASERSAIESNDFFLLCAASKMIGRDDAMCDVGQWQRSAFRVYLLLSFNSLITSPIVSRNRCSTTVARWIGSRHPQNRLPSAAVTLRNWFRFNRLGESGNLWFRVENWPPFNCIFSRCCRCHCYRQRNHFFSAAVFFSSVKIIKRNLSHSVCCLILNLWLSGRVKLFFFASAFFTSQ